MSHIDTADTSLLEAARGCKHTQKIRSDLLGRSVSDLDRIISQVQKRLREHLAAKGNIRTPAHIKKADMGNFAIGGSIKVHVVAAVMNAIWLEALGELAVVGKKHFAVGICRDHRHRTVGMQIDRRLDKLDAAVHRDGGCPCFLPDVRDKLSDGLCDGPENPLRPFRF